MKENTNFNKIKINVLVHSFVKINSILTVIASYHLIVQKSNFWTINYFYIQLQNALKKVIEDIISDDEDVNLIIEQIKQSDILNFKSLSDFIELFELSMLQEYIKNISSILSEIQHLMIKYNITERTYFWIQFGNYSLQEIKEKVLMDINDISDTHNNPLLNIIEFDINLEQYLLDYTKEVIKAEESIGLREKSKLVFNKDNGDVLIWSVLLWNLKPWTRYFKFFEILFNNLNKELLNEQIKNYINSWNISKSTTNYLSDIKGRLPEKIKNIIESTNWWYIIKG